MKRITYWFMSTLTAVVLLFGYRTSTSSQAAGTVATAGPVAGGTTSGSAGSSGAASSSAASSSSAATGSSGTYTGEVTSTRWGPVQVRITVSSGKITAVDVVQHPSSNGRDQQINAYAIPTLVDETLEAQSAKIDTVSGATVTSDGYLTSLQSALDKAGL